MEEYKDARAFSVEADESLMKPKSVIPVQCPDARRGSLCSGAEMDGLDAEPGAETRCA